jgi:hypothetical protein
MALWVLLHIGASGGSGAAPDRYRNFAPRKQTGSLSSMSVAGLANWNAGMRIWETRLFVSHFVLAHTRIQDVSPSDDRAGAVGEDRGVSKPIFAK